MSLSQEMREIGEAANHEVVKAWASQVADLESRLTEAEELILKLNTLLAQNTNRAAELQAIFATDVAAWLSSHLSPETKETRPQ